MRKEIRICPKCGSIDVREDYSKGLVFIAGVPSNYKCRNCSFASVLFPLVEIDRIEEFRKKIKK